LHNLLSQHPGVYVPPGKEMNFFNRRAFPHGSAYSGFGLTERAIEQMRNYLATTVNVWPPWPKLLAHIAAPSNDQAWYEGVFDLPLPDRIRGEITPEYAMLPRHGFEEMLALNPNAKVLLLLRDPVERAISQLGMIIDQAPIATSFVAELAREDSLLQRGRYEAIVPMVRSVFAPEQLLIVCIDEIAAEPKAALERIANFLGVDGQLFPADRVAAKVYERSSRLQVGAEIENDLRSYYGQTLRFAAEIFPSARGWQAP
jgi:hypothetical protein